MLVHKIKTIGLYIRKIQSKTHLSVWKSGLLLFQFLRCSYRYSRPVEENLLYLAPLSDKRTKETVFFTSDFVSFVEHINDQKQIYILRNKQVLLERLKDQLYRRFLYAGDASKEELLSFLRETPRFVLKPGSAAGGVGVKEVTVTGPVLEVFRLREKERYTLDEAAGMWLGKNLLLEEYIVQHSAICAIYEKSVNTIRIHTVQVNGNVDTVLMSSIRFGSGGGNIDFDHGICVGIYEDGTLYPWGINLEDIAGARIYSHPDTGAAFASRRIPYWDEALALVKRTALAVPEVCFIGWDVAITPTGPVIVEGNGAPASYMQEQVYRCDMDGVGIKPEMTELLQQTLLRKQWTRQDIERITQQVFLPEDPSLWETCRTVIVLGSTACDYRVECAWRLFQGRPVRYIVCGGNRCSYLDAHGRNMPEADYMRERLLQHGVPAKDITLDNQSVSTFANIQNAAKFIDKNGLDGPFGIVTGGFHLRRVQNALDALALAGQFVLIPAYGPNTRPDNWFCSCTGTKIILNELEKLAGLINGAADCG